MGPSIILKDGDEKLLPTYAHENDAGFDIRSNEDVSIEPGTFKTIRTGIKFGIPKGWQIDIRSRSGLASRFGIIVLNSPGLIDQGYKDEVKIILANFGVEVFEVKKYDRIAQGTMAPSYHIEFDIVENLDMTGDRNGGLGSTGV